MTNSSTLEASSRIALAAFLHDLGKFAERARIPEAEEKDVEGNTRADINKQLYCPEFKGRRTHVHAAYTAVAMDLLERHLPDLVGDDMTPFSPWGEKNADDSIINAAAKHHWPDTFLQWVIATADRLASGFEREEFDNYNAASDDEVKKLNHYTTRQWTLLEHIHLPYPQGKSSGAEDALPQYRYPLKPMSPEAVFPVPLKNCEGLNKTTAQEQYRALWNTFKAGLEDIPKTHRRSLPLWLDHFDSLWLTFTHAIPSATAGIGGNVRPDVSLYDHSKTTAALATALWRYHTDQGHDIGDSCERLRTQWDQKRKGTAPSEEVWKEAKFLLVQGDFFGIQNFIFAEGGQTQRRAAKLLRGRSFYVSLLTELAALKILESLDLPATSQVVNAAGKFLIVAPHTPQIIEKLCSVRAELDAWFLKHTFGQSGIGLAWQTACSADFLHGSADESPFRLLIKRLFEQLEDTKHSRFNLCGDIPISPVFHDFLDRFKHGECRIDGRSPATEKLETDIWVSALALDQINTGKWLATQDRLLVTREPIQPLQESQRVNQLKTEVFGFNILLTRDEEKTGNFSGELKAGNLLRAWDFSLPESFDKPLWNGYARRHINAYVPRFGQMNEWEVDRYQGIENPEIFDPHPQEIKTFNHLARDDLKPLFNRDGQIIKTKDGKDRFIGAEALMTLKGDVDNLGLIFEQGLLRPTFARMAALSRQVNDFFTVWLPWLCASEFRDTYTVFAGGDDFFLIGPWHSTIQLARRMRADFHRYVAENPDIHFSAGLSMTKPGLPIGHISALAEGALESSKERRTPGSGPEQQWFLVKDAVTCFGYTIAWTELEKLCEINKEVELVSEKLKLSTGYLYGLQYLAHMAGRLRNGEYRMDDVLWNSRFVYRTRRMLDRNRELDKAAKSNWQDKLATLLAGNMNDFGSAFNIALFIYLYQHR